MKFNGIKNPFEKGKIGIGVVQYMPSKHRDLSLISSTHTHKHTHTHTHTHTQNDNPCKMTRSLISKSFIEKLIFYIEFGF
jgi:hypothetical protein